MASSVFAQLAVSRKMKFQKYIKTVIAILLLYMLNIHMLILRLLIIIYYSDWNPSDNPEQCFLMLLVSNKYNNEIMEIFQINNQMMPFLKKSKFNSSLPVKLLVHGFSDSAHALWASKVTHEYFEHNETTNILILDWSRMAVAPWYYRAVTNMEKVAKHVVKLLESLNRDFNVPFANMHLIGASLGAHLAGKIGKLLSGEIGHITGLDPCSLLINGFPKNHRLNKKDAKFVEVIHTAGSFVGNDVPMGHVDIFPNLGRAPQPSCKDKESLDLACSHFFAWRMYTNSFIARNATQIHYMIKCKSVQDYERGECCNRLPHEVAIFRRSNPSLTRGIFLVTTFLQGLPKKSVNSSINCNNVTSKTVKWIGLDQIDFADINVNF